MFRKKGQAALEFLTTYGWAFLVILVMIGALAYFGVLNPTKFVPDTCTFSAAFKCEDHVLDTTNGLTINLRNNLEAIVIQNITITDLDSNEVSSKAGSAIADGQADMASGSQKTIVIPEPNNAGWEAGDKKKVDIKLIYHLKSSDAMFTKSVGGEAVGTVQ